MTLFDSLERPDPQPIGRDGSLDRRFDAWREANEELISFVVARALAAARSGATRLSTKHLLEEARATHVVTLAGRRDFLIDNTYSGELARWLMARYPELDGLFEIRRRRGS